MSAAHNVELVDHALQYAQRGALVFPVDPTDKTPLTRHGMLEATSDTEQVAAWWRKYPNALIGCRIPETMVVLDVDPRHNGHDTWQRVQDEHTTITPERVHMSGRGDGGGHHWFERPDGKLSIKPLNEWAQAHNVGTLNEQGRWISGIDILHHNHRYTILPPSPHPETGNPYSWVRQDRPGPMPTWLTQLLIEQPKPATPPTRNLRPVHDTDSIADWFTVTSTWAQILEPHGWTMVSGGGEHDGSKWRHPSATAAYSATIKHGCLFVYSDNTPFDVTEHSSPAGLTRFKAWATLEHNGDMKAAAKAARVMRDGEPLAPSRPPANVDPDTGEIRTDDSLIEWATPIPLGEATNTPTFPVDTLPDWIAEHVLSVAAEQQCAVDLPAMLALAALAVTQAGHINVHVKNTWHETANLYLVVALPPGAGKSPVIRRMFGPIERSEIEQREAIAAERKVIEQRRRMTESKQKKAELAGDEHTALGYLVDLEAESMQVPPIPRLIADDATPEALTTLLSEQHGRMALISAEGGPFDMMTGRYSDKANFDVYLQAWSGDTIRTDRVGRGSFVITQPLLTVCLTVQPAVIAKLAEKPELAGRGLTARFMYAVPRDFVGSRNLMDDTPVDPGILNRYDRNLAALVRPGRPAQPQTIAMHDDARRLYLTWRQSLEERRRPDADLRPLAEWTIKLESSVARTAGLLAVADRTDIITVDTMQRAIDIGCYWLAHAKIVHDLWGTDDTLTHARQVLAWARQRQVERFSLRDVYGSMRKAFPTAADVVPVVSLLTERGWVLPVEEGPITTGKRGRPSPEFVVHPMNLSHSVSESSHAVVEGQSGANGPDSLHMQHMTPENDENLWISTSHARHVSHVSRDISEDSLTHSEKDSARTRNRAHETHDAHDHITAETESDPPAIDHGDLFR